MTQGKMFRRLYSKKTQRSLSSCTKYPHICNIYVHSCWTLEDLRGNVSTEHTFLSLLEYGLAFPKQKHRYLFMSDGSFATTFEESDFPAQCFKFDKNHTWICCFCDKHKYARLNFVDGIGAGTHKLSGHYDIQKYRKRLKIAREKMAETASDEEKECLANLKKHRVL